jgi:hypothetical protein
MTFMRSEMIPVLLRPLLAALLLLSGLLPAAAMAQRALSSGQSLYLPIYSVIQYGDLDRSGTAREMPVSSLVSIHNTDLDKPIRLLAARYYATDGKFLRDFVSSPRVLKPMETVEFLVERRDVVGGSGANFVIQWDAAAPASPPLVQALHIELQTNRAIVFTTDAVVIPR